MRLLTYAIRVFCLVERARNVPLAQMNAIIPMKCVIAKSAWK